MRSIESVREEVDCTLRVAAGALPQDLRGTLYRIGPGKFEVFGTKYDHPFDGDGMVLRFEFDGSGVRYRNRFVRTQEYVAETRAERMLYRSFGTNLPGGLGANLMRLKIKNAANTHVLVHGGALYALWEGGLPHRLDPVTLETVRREDFGGMLRNRTDALSARMSPELPFSAHPKRDPQTGDVHNFGTLMGKEHRLMRYRLRADGTLDAPTFLPMDGLTFLHDFVLTPRYEVYFRAPLQFRVAAMLAGLTTPVGSLRAAEGANAQILVVPRDGGPPMTLEARPGFVFHFANGFEDSDERIVLDGMRMDALPDPAATKALMDGQHRSMPTALPTRYELDLRTGAAREHALSRTPSELPTMDERFQGRPYRHLWAVAGEPYADDPYFTQLVHMDLARGETRRDFSPDLPGEAVFVPLSEDAAEGDGYVLTVVYRTEHHRSDLYVLDAQTLRTVCRLELPHHVPMGFHGTWVEADAPAPPESADA